MASQRFISIFERHIAQFVGHFSEDSNSLFKNEKNRLIHPGEYGRYREDSCKQLLRLILDNRMSISDGFVFTADDAITTQCDIIVYNSTATPLIADGIAKLFPAEEVRMIGEIKSTLDRQSYVDALRKLALNKQLVLEGRRGLREPDGDNIAEKTGDTIVTFLICGKLSFDHTSLVYSDVYDGIDQKYWHNAVLSMEDGFFAYELGFQAASEQIKRDLDRVGYIYDTTSLFAYPVCFWRSEQILNHQASMPVDKENKYDHIGKFFVTIASCCTEIKTYRYDPVDYIGFLGGPLFKTTDEKNGH